MRYLFSAVVCLIWALWLGGLCAVGLTAYAIARAFHGGGDAMATANSSMFHRFEQYELILAAASLLATFGWVLARRSTMKTALFTFLALSGALAYFETTTITPRIDKLRTEHKTATPSFQQAHHWATEVYGAQTLILALGGLLLPLAFRADQEKPV